MAQKTQTHVGEKVILNRCIAYVHFVGVLQTYISETYIWNDY